MRLILDTDPAMGVLGGDPEDAFAITLCVLSPELELAGVTAVNGNVPVRLAHANARHVLDLLGAGDVPLAAGPARPLMPHRTTQLAWQAQKLELPVITPGVGADDPVVTAPQQIVRTLLDSDEPTTVLAIGPLTNLALAVLLEPRIVQAVDRVVMMGGKGGIAGNVTPAAEFNFWCDPEAAAIVLAQRWPMTLVTLEVCHQVRLTAEDLGSRPARTAMGRFAREACGPWLEHAAHGDGFPLFDTLATAVLLEPGLVTTEPAWTQVDVSDGPSAGSDMSWRGHDPLGAPVTPNLDLAVAVDADRFMALFRERILDRI